MRWVSSLAVIGGAIFLTGCSSGSDVEDIPAKEVFLCGDTTPRDQLEVASYCDELPAVPVPEVARALPEPDLRFDNPEDTRNLGEMYETPTLSFEELTEWYEIQMPAEQTFASAWLWCGEENLKGESGDQGKVPINARYWTATALDEGDEEPIALSLALVDRAPPRLVIGQLETANAEDIVEDICPDQSGS